MTTASVAADVLDRNRVNRVALRPEFRIFLRLGEIERLFASTRISMKGRAARLQVLGLFYFPLRSTDADRAFPTTWSWVKERVFGVKSDEEADDRIQRALLERVVGPAWAPFRSTKDGPLLPNLPPAGEFAKIRIPGGYTHRSNDSKSPFGYGRDIFDAERVILKDNPVLGKIPLIARVERRVGNEPWEPAPNVPVYFQFLPPDPLANFDPSQPPGKQYGRPSATPGVENNLQSEETIFDDLDDPQRGNCHKVFDGKRGYGKLGDATDVAGVLFEMKEVPGFPFPPPRLSPDLQHAHAVEAKTNESGEAGVLFLPSRLGGDRYKFRAHRGTLRLKDDGTEDDAVRVDTGTLVTWRNVRISRYLRKDVSTPFWPDFMEDLKSSGFSDELDYLTESGAADDHRSLVGLPTLDFTGLARSFACAFCEVETDGDLSVPEPIPGEEYVAAHARARTEAIRGMNEIGRTWDIDTILYPAPVSGTSHLPELLSLREPGRYNAKLLGGDPKRIRMDGSVATPREARALDSLTMYLYAGIVRTLSREGALPGLTILQSSNACTWQTLKIVDDFGGLAFEHRAYFVVKGNDSWTRSDAFAHVNAHEAGHCLFLEHAPDPLNSAAGIVANKHDPLTHADHYCTMSYIGGEPGFCSECLRVLRGWMR